MIEMPILPDINFVETDAQAIIDDIINGYEQIAGVTLAQADPRRLYLLALAYIIVQQRQQIDTAGKSNTLYYSQGDFLDHIGAMRMTHRLPAIGAMTTVRFTLSQAQPMAIGIPQGTRVTADGQLFWATTKPETIQSGDLFADIQVQALTAGSEANGLAAGEISTLVDPIPFVQTVTNTTETQGGSNRESDDNYRRRVYSAPAAFSTAGPTEAYEYWAYTASSAISDVVALSPSPGVAEIRPLLRGGEIPGQEILDKVYDVLSPSDIRPLTDKVEVKAPDPVSYVLNIKYFIRSQDQGSIEFIKQRVNQAVTDYVAWQRAKLGRDINPDELICRVRAAGAKRLEMSAPLFKKIERYQVAQESSVFVDYGGAEDE